MSLATPALAAPAAPPPSLWRHRNFRYFWVGQSTSMFGSVISFIALPLVGVLVLNLDAFQMGVIASGSTIPGVIVSPFVGTIADRVNRRMLMIVCDLGRALLIASIPVAALLGVLSFWQLIVVGGALAVLTRLFDVTCQAFLPAIVSDEQLGDGNSKLEASQSASDVGGPGVAGWLIGHGGGPAVAMTVDAVSFVVSALSLMRLRLPAPSTSDTNSPPGRPFGTDSPADHSRGAGSAEAGAGVRRFREGFWRDTVEGFRVVFHDPVLRSVSISYAALALFAQVQMAVYLLFLVRWVDFSPTMIGVVFSLSGVVGFGAAIVSGKLTNRIGVGRLLVLGQASMVAGGVLLAAVAGSTLQAAATMLVAEAFFAIGMSFWGVGSRTLYQTRVADDVRGRVIGASGVLTGVLVALSGFIGGGIGLVFGLRAALIAGAAGMFCALVLVLRRQVWEVRIT